MSPVLKYIIRAVKQFFYFTVILVIMILILVVMGAVEGSPEKIFRGGWQSYWQIAAMLGALCAIYPFFGYGRRTVRLGCPLDDVSDVIDGVMSDRGYRLKEKTEDGRKYILRNPVNRISRLFEDTVTVSQTLEGVSLEGLRKDIVRVASALETALRRRQSGPEGE